MVAVASLGEREGGGRTAPGDTLQGGDTRTKKKLWMNLQRIVDKRSRTGKKGRQFFSGNNRGDTLICRPSDTNPSDATV